VNAMRTSGKLWPLLVTLALAGYGCGGGGGGDSSTSTEPDMTMDDAAMPGDPVAAAPKPKPKPASEEPEEEVTFPEEFSEWKLVHYERAKKDGDPRLLEAVAFLGANFADSPHADAAAEVLRKVLAKSETPPEPKTRPGQRAMGGYPGDEMGMTDPGMMEGYDPEMMMEADGMPGMPGMPGGPPGRAKQPPRLSGSAPQLVEAIVFALGEIGSPLARQTLKEVIEAKFETDNNRVATLASLETLVAHLCAEYEEILYQCLTAPEKLRELGKTGPARRPGGPGMPGMEMEYEEPMYGPEDMMAGPGMGGMRGPQQVQAPLTAEELQQEAFDLLAPRMSPEFRVRLAKYVADRNTPQEDYALFSPFLCELDARNLEAQMVLLATAGIDPQTKSELEDHFISYSSDALAGILGIPVDKRRTERQRRARSRPSMDPAMPGMEMDPEYDAEMMADPAAMDPRSMMPGDRGRAPGGTASGRPSRYDRGTDTGRPSRYDATRPGAGPQAPPSFEADTSDPDLPYRLAQQLWGGDLPKALQARLGQVSSLDSEANLILLASTMPIDSVRSALGGVLKARWQDGPGALEDAGLLDQVVTDPGFLMLVKALPRTEPEAGAKIAPGRRPRTTGRTRVPGAAPGGMPGEMGYEEGMMAPGAPGPGGRARASGDPGEAWMHACEDLLRTTCQRLQSARAQGKAGDEALPVEVHPDATVVADYRLDWPAADQAKLSGVPLGDMKLHYVRLEQTARPKIVKGYYTRKLTAELATPKVRDLPDGMWLESMRNVPDTGRQRSLDVLVTIPGAGATPIDENADTPLTIEILSIEMKNPAAAEG